MMRSFRPIILLVVVFLLLAGPATRGQIREQDPRQTDAIRVETSLVTVPAIVTDRAGRFVPGLISDDFQLFEDGKPQEITSFSSTETPFNVALLIDTSRSAREVLGEIRKAARNFVDQLQPQDRVLIVTFDEQVNFHGDFTRDRRKLRRSIGSAKSSYLTAVYDAISRTINEKLAPLKGRKAIVVFSDGVDTWSQHASYESTLDLVARSGALIYAVQYNTSNIGGTATAPYLLPRRYFAAPSVSGQQNSMRAEFERYRIATNFLRAVAEQSGARHLQAANIENSERAFALIADELRNQYLLEYYSTNDRQDGGYRSITARLKRGDLVVRARKGYRAPKAENRGIEKQETKPPSQPRP